MENETKLFLLKRNFIFFIIALMLFLLGLDGYSFFLMVIGPFSVFAIGNIFLLIKYRNYEVCRINEKEISFIKTNVSHPFSDIEIFMIYRVRGFRIIKIDECIVWVDGIRTRAFVRNVDRDKLALLKRKMRLKDMKKTLIYRTFSFT